MVSTNEISSLKNLVSIENLPFETEIVALSPASLLEVATKKAEEGKFTTEKELVPLYIRPSQAEANLKN